MNSIKLTYINYVQMIKFMSSDFFVLCFIVISKRSGLVLIVTWWSFDEPSITRNGQSRPCGRHTLIEIDLIRLEAVFVAMLCTRWMSVRDVKYRWLKLALKCWVDDLNEICCCASFVCWPKMFLVLLLLRSFLKIFVRTSPGAFEVLKVDVLNLLTSPGAFEILCQVSFLFELINPFKIDFEKMNCAGSFYCQIIGWSLTMKRKKVFWILQKFSSFSEWLELFSLIFGIVVVVFADDDAKDLLIEALIWWNFCQSDKRNLEKIWLLFKLENMFLILTPGIIQTPLWRTFDGGSPEDSMDDREVDSR
jgi:hypothetical protein